MSVLTKYTGMIDKRLRELLDVDGTNRTVKEAMNYSVSAGGKRLRPTLNIMANALLDGDIEETMDIACALEMIHTYSLIHDDLPAMDNDTLRRGKPTNHVVYGEGMAILCGDALLNYAYEVMLQNAMRYPENLQAHLQAMDAVAKSAGIFGMVTGQCCDIENEGKTLSAEEVDFVHRHKTGAIIKSALLSGLLLCNPEKKYLDAISLYGEDIGVTFQIIDDVLDVVGDEKLMGKTLGKDADEEKFTFVTLFGVEESMRIARQKTEEAIAAMDVFGEKGKDLSELAEVILKRKK
ncbi:MAG: farnesyl diphosphate synthase [Christensenella sp.]|nr:farnesyl diphosphate synthase [Christensenella sp.]